ncbi:MAG: DUF5979 domain-containing protein [Corynebacterium sp.]|uniref:DUF5979 domain-containing protein n=1 Tax=Corynebacterium sp. TaxID=1720 RepID=UPI0026E07F85|nr:DUF5979 domain-containing protein [Corynebacterium sp.]MDO5670950.1 DUF5979 domain-containing protein [Corynebacterium sp.]
MSLLSPLAGRVTRQLQLIIALALAILLVLGFMPAVSHAQTEPETDDTTAAELVEPGAEDVDPLIDEDVMQDGGLEQALAVATGTDNPNIVIDNITLTTGNIPIQQFTRVDVTWDWRAENSVTDGEQFSLTFPEELAFTQDTTFDLVDDGKVGGSCVVTRATQTVTCTFNDAFEGQDNVGGELQLQTQAVTITSQESVDFELGTGATITVPLPGEGGIVAETVVVDNDIEKWGWFEGGSQGATAVWTVNIPGSLIADDNPETFTIEDVLTSDLHEFTGFVESRANVYADTGQTQLGDYAPLTGRPGVSMVVGDPATTAEITVSRPVDGWNPQHHYRVRYHTQTTEQRGLPVGTEIGNKAQILEREFTRSITYSQTGSGTIRGVERGSFEVTKQLEGSEEAKAKIPANTVFTVQATYLLDGEEMTETISVLADGTPVAGERMLPRGTQVTLSEINLPEIDGITFGDPVFSGGENVEISADGKSAVLTTIETDNVAVTLTNTVEISSGSFAVTKELSGLSGSSARNDEFEIEASWTVDGEDESQVFTVKAGETFSDFPALPVGTVVTLKETKPANTLIAEWNTPVFSSDTPGAVTDNGDGTATLIIQEDSTEKATLVKVTNSANPPWWWILVPLVPIIGSSIGSSTSSGSSAPVPDQPGQTVEQPGQPGDIPEDSKAIDKNYPNKVPPTVGQPGVEKQQTPQRTLAQTGASVLGIVALALALGAAGVLLIRRSRA